MSSKVGIPDVRRNILFITTDQQRFDAIGCNGGRVARTPVVDSLAKAGIRYERCHVQNVVCMPSRATMVTGQYPRTHGVVSNGIALPESSATIIHLLKQSGYQTGLVGKAHFDPIFDLQQRYAQNRLAKHGSTGPWRGFDHVELAIHAPLPSTHYGRWLARTRARDLAGFGWILTGAAGGDTGAPEVKHNPIDRRRYHTDWVADRSVHLLKRWAQDSPKDKPFFLWMSFPDPHHPWDPPKSEHKRVPWRDLPAPKGWPKTAHQARKVLADKPQHWLDWYDGRFKNPEGGSSRFVPARLREEQMREIDALIHIENELIDEAIGQVLAQLVASGLDANTDIVFTSDHGELQGDFGLLFKGPYHVDALMRVPLVWRPAPASQVNVQVVHTPVGLVDLAPTMCEIAGLPVPAWMQGRPLPTIASDCREYVLTEWDSQFARVGMHLRTIFDGRWLATAYLPSTHNVGGRFPILEALMPKSDIPVYDGTEGELYDTSTDPDQHHNLWDDQGAAAERKRLVEMLAATTPTTRSPLPVDAPV